MAERKCADCGASKGVWLVDRQGRVECVTAAQCAASPVTYEEQSEYAAAYSSLTAMLRDSDSGVQADYLARAGMDSQGRLDEWRVEYAQARQEAQDAL